MNTSFFHDMLGSIAEWCPDASDRPLPIRAKVPLRGGKGNDGPRDVRSASRFLTTADNPTGGFRVLRELPGRG